jgi:hypothetical protein
MGKSKVDYLSGLGEFLMTGELPGENQILEELKNIKALVIEYDMQNIVKNA